MSQKDRAHRAFVPGFVKLAALVLTALTLCAALASHPAQAAEWMEPYLDQVRTWGIMRGDANGNMNEDRPITRAEFVTLVNRAFGYTQTGPHTFADVGPSDWFAEDISIAHNVGYFQGTSPTTAAPLNLVSREQAAVLLGRSLRLQGVTGAANSTFTDMQNIGGWSRGLVQEAADLGIIQGYPDGTFRPEQSITRGQMACFLVRALGTLIQEPGEQVSGGVYGNLTITTPNVKLKDTTITGNLYLSGGVGLGNVELENVEVLGKIIVCGGGEAEKGDHSIILRNVTAPTMEVDSISGQFLSIQAEGLTDIGEVTIRTPSFVQDLTEDGLGFQNIRLDGDGEFEGGVQLQLAGNLKNIINLTPNSSLQIAQGVAKVVTVDEKAVDSVLSIDNIASIKELNLDRGTEVTGEGSISHVNINAPGSKVEMLPDTIFVRPGISGNVNRVEMDNKVATESSEEPRLLARYPYAKNIAPTSADAVFSTNKSGTVYWGLTALMDGSLGEEELMNPTNYSAKIIRNGTVAVNTSNTEATARLTGLTRSGSYYISALVVDARGHRSPVKVAAFTTPDDSAPNFSTGYPQAPILTLDQDGEQVAQIMVMATKDCQMYYALMPRGSAAPTAADFRAGALPGNLGSGIVTLRKNTPFLLSRINTSYLAEKTQYDLYLWLSDADNGKSSAVRRVQLTTNDITPPTIQELIVQSYNATSVTLRFALDEPGVLSWFVAKRDEKVGINREEPTEADKIKIENIPVDGVKVLRKGGPVRASQAGVPVNFTVSGLQGQTAYDLYYVAKDTAGNYCVYTKAIEFPLPIKTLDNENPTVEVTFSISDPGETEGTVFPRVNSDVSLEFSEVVRGSQGEDAYDEFLALYEDVERAAEGVAKDQAKNTLAAALHRHIRLYPGNPPGRGDPQSPEVTAASSLTPEELEEEAEWIDFREARVSQAGAKTVITFPGDNDKNQSEGITPAIKLQSGRSYFFRLEDIEDTSLNPMKNTPPNVIYTPKFTTASAIVHLTTLDSTRVDYNGNIHNDATIFLMEPDATEFAPDSSRWDMILWAYANIDYDLYVREAGGSWSYLGTMKANMSSSSKVYNSMYGNFRDTMIQSGLFGMTEDHEGLPYLNRFTKNLEFGIVPVEGKLDADVRLDVELYTGTNVQMRPLSSGTQGTQATFPAGLEHIGVEHPHTLTISANSEPTVSIVTNTINPGDSGVSFRMSLNQRGKVYYWAIPIGKDSEGQNPVLGNSYSLPIEFYPRAAGETEVVRLEDIPMAQSANEEPLWLNPRFVDPYAINMERAVPPEVKRGETGNAFNADRGGVTDISISGLKSDTTYLLYLSSENTNTEVRYQYVRCYKFTTTPPVAPVITIVSDYQNNSVDITLSTEAEMHYILLGEDSIAGTVFNYNFGPQSPYINPDVRPAPDWGQNKTVLEAMMETVSGGGSLFDRYATEEFKKDCYAALKDPSSESRYPNGKPVMDNGTDSNEVTHDAFALQGMGWLPYYLIVGGNPHDSSSYGFKAAGPYRRQSNEYLKVRCQAYVNDKAPETSTLTIFFSDDPYVHMNDGRIVPVDGCGPGDGRHINSAVSNNYISIGRAWYPTSGQEMITPKQTPDPHGKGMGRTMEIQFPTSRSTIEFTFDSGLSTSNGGVRTNDKGAPIALRITLTKKMVGEDVTWVVSYSDPDWELT